MVLARQLQLKVRAERIEGTCENTVELVDYVVQVREERKQGLRDWEETWKLSRG